MTEQVDRVQNPQTRDPDEDLEEQAFRSDQDARTRLAISYVHTSAPSNIAQAILDHDKARQLMEETRIRCERHLTGQQDNEAEVSLANNGSSYASAAKAKTPKPAPSEPAHSNILVRVRNTHNVQVQSILQMALNLFRTSATPLPPHKWQQPSNKQLELGCSAAVGCYTMGPRLQGPGQSVVQHPDCPYSLKQFMSGDDTVSRAAAAGAAPLHIVMSGFPQRTRGADTSARQILQRLISLGLVH